MRSILSHALLASLVAAPLFAAESNAPKEPAAVKAEVGSSTSQENQTAPPSAPASKITYTACNVDGPFVAMTFDDGPHAQLTPRLLDLLKQRGIKATFFVIGQNAAEYPEILNRIAAEGHEIANHSFTHPSLATLGEAGVREQLEKTHQTVLKTTGVNMKVMRPPYGALTETQRRWVKANFGYSVILWDVDPLDWKFRDASRVEREILGHTKAGSIILTHDIHKSTIDAMASTLDALAAKGFKFVTVSELLAMDKPGAPKPAAPPKAEKSAKKEEASASKPSAKASASNKSRKVETEESREAKPVAKKAPKTEEEARQKWLQMQNQR